MQRRRSVPHRFEDQIAAEKARLEAQAASLPAGPKKEGLLKKIRQLETVAHISDWLSSPGRLNWRPLFRAPFPHK